MTLKFYLKGKTALNRYSKEFSKFSAFSETFWDQNGLKPFHNACLGEEPHPKTHPNPSDIHSQEFFWLNNPIWYFQASPKPLTMWDFTCSWPSLTFFFLISLASSRNLSSPTALAAAQVKPCRTDWESLGIPSREKPSGRGTQSSTLLFPDRNLCFHHFRLRYFKRCISPSKFIPGIVLWKAWK